MKTPKVKLEPEPVPKELLRPQRYWDVILIVANEIWYRSEQKTP